jgi:thiol-disulfide isomerase/thioredoxin
MVERVSERIRSRPLHRRVLRWAFELALLVLLYIGVTAWQTRHALVSGEKLPNLELRTLDDHTFNLDGAKGRPRLVHVWATWCGACKREIGTLRELFHAASGRYDVVTIVADGEDPERVRTFLRDHLIDYPVLLGNDAVVSALGVTALPTNYFLDAGGEIVTVSVGMGTALGYRARLGCARAP